MALNRGGVLSMLCPMSNRALMKPPTFSKSGVSSCSFTLPPQRRMGRMRDLRGLMRRSVRWFLRNGRAELGIQNPIERVTVQAGCEFSDTGFRAQLLVLENLDHVQVIAEFAGQQAQIHTPCEFLVTAADEDTDAGHNPTSAAWYAGSV